MKRPPRGPKLRCDICPHGTSGFFRRLPAEVRRHLAAEATPHVLPAGHQLFDEGAPPLAVHCIHTGLVKVFKLTVRGEEQIIRLLRGGDLVGYRAVLAGEPFGATAQALEETTVCTIPAPVLLALIRRSPDFALDALAKVSQELRVSEESLIDLPRKSVRQRLAAVLLLLAEARSSATSKERMRVVRLSRRDLARLIATTPESVSRALHRFAAERAVECTRAEIRLLSISALRRAAGDDPFLAVDRRQVSD